MPASVPAAPTSNGNGGGLSMASLKNSLLSIPGTGTPSRSSTPDHRVENTSGYIDTVFAGKSEQAAGVQKLLKSKGFIPPDLVDAEVQWFYQ